MLYGALVDTFSGHDKVPYKLLYYYYYYYYYNAGCKDLVKGGSYVGVSLLGLHRDSISLSPFKIYLSQTFNNGIYNAKNALFLKIIKTLKYIESYRKLV